MKTFVVLLMMMVIYITPFANTTEKIERILKSGDGKSSETAFEVYSTSEEYELLQYFEKKVKMQLLYIVKEESFDVIHTNNGIIWFKLIAKPQLILS